MNIKYADRMQKIKPSPIRALMHLVQQPGVISFAGGWPAPESLPMEELKEISKRVIANYGAAALQYSATEGYRPLLEVIAKRMNKFGIDVTADNVMITSGSQQLLDFVGKLFINEGDVVLCESPSYIGALGAFAGYCPKFVDVKMDEDGMNMEHLEECIKANPNAKFIYTIPDFQNPTGRSMSIEKRKTIVALSEKYNIPVVEDNPYYELRFEGERIPPIKSFDKTGMVIYFGSFSKTFCPGLRVGWVCCDPEIRSKFILIKQGADLHTSMLSQLFVYEFLTSYDFDKHVETIKHIYLKRRNAMVDTLEELLPEGFTCTRPQGGMFTWVKLREGLNSEEVFHKTVEQKVAFVPGDAFFPNGGDTNHIRLNYGTMTEAKIIEGITRFANVIKTL
ncbi:aminotransferase-like domain-containing protein [Anaerotignum sp.]|uniref:aminotransferase-like domain-containing protein n=1 Tax=Anaerotignum sp. TaxID=2039241 RepID=UPI002714B05B|nr:PLP-dependent aminotransferase family protein [Anaerotignum sp.]